MCTDRSCFPIQGIETSHESTGRLYSLLLKERRQANASHADLSMVLRLNNPSRAEDKLHNDSPDSIDPVIEHLMGSRAFRLVIKIFFGMVLFLGITFFFMGEDGGSETRLLVLGYGGVPCFLILVPFTTAVAIVCSRRLR